MDYSVHPYAAQFPMLDDDELIALAADITARGQEKPIMLDHTGEMLLDGRNRLKACSIAGVEPRIERLAEGIDPVAYIITANIRRRHLTKGQQAVAEALAHPEASGVLLSSRTKINRQQINEAREIVAHADLVQQVMSKAVSFDHALGEARWRDSNAMTAKQRQRQLQNEAPDLAEAVTAGQMSLYAAVMELERRWKQASANHKKAREAVVEALGVVAAGWKNGLDLRQDEAFRAALIDRLKIDPTEIKAALAGLDRFVSKTG